MNPCPTAEQLAEGLQLPADCPEFQALATHVDGCPRCQLALERLTAEGGQTVALLPRKPVSAADSAVLGHLKKVLPSMVRSIPPKGPSDNTFVLSGRHLSDAPPRDLAPGQLPRLQHEIRDLLQKRLRAFSVVVA